MTDRGGRATSTPARARSYNRCPFCLRALYMGGICSMSPMNKGNVCRMSDRVMLRLGLPAVIVPSESYVSLT